MISFVEQAAPKAELRNFVANPYYVQSEDDNAAKKSPPKIDTKLYFQLSIPYAAGNDEKSKDSAVEAPPPADVLVLADTSSSMRNNRLLREMVGDILRRLRPEDRFRLAVRRCFRSAARRAVAFRRRRKRRCRDRCIRQRVLSRRHRSRHIVRPGG